MTGAQKTVIVTGAASGIGEACALLLLEKGHNVAAIDRDRLRPALIGAPGAGRLLQLQADVSDAESCAAAVNDAASHFGAVNGLVHMAAVHSTATWRELDAAEFNRTLAINVTGSFLVSQACARLMEQAGGGAIVMACSGSISVSGVGGHGRGGPAYVASKAAIIGLTRALARSLAPQNIRVNAVSPGSTDTAMTAHYDDQARAGVAARTLAGRIGEPREIAAVAAFLLSDAAGYVHGEIVNVNGGGSFGL